MAVFEGQYLQANSHKQETICVYDTRKKLLIEFMAFEMTPEIKVWSSGRTGS